MTSIRGHRTRVVAGGTALAALAALAVTALGSAADATPNVGFSGSTFALGRYDEIDLMTNNGAPYKVQLRTRGESDVYVVNNVVAPGGHSGWHTHPGPSLITVKSGAITAYHGDDPSCTPTVYTAGMGFVDPGGDHVHLLRNEGSVEAVTVAVQFLPAGATRRIDAPAPGNCPF